MLRRGFTGEKFLFKDLVVKTPPVQKLLKSYCETPTLNNIKLACTRFMIFLAVLTVIKFQITTGKE
jgi:hypothetical protein